MLTMSFIVLNPGVLLGLISGFLTIISTVQSSPLCFDDLGCFSTSYPYTNANGKVPVKHKNAHYLYASTNKYKATSLSYLPDSVKNISNVNFSLPLKVIIHGFNSDHPAWMYKIKGKLLKVDPDQNIYIVSWKDGASFPDYDQAVANTRLVSKEVFLVLQQFEALGLSLDDVHLIGHSLGAHISGDIGRLFGGQVGRISGLDPASPGFDDFPARVRLDASDAKFVDVIHTDAKEGGSDDDPIFKALCGGLGSYQAAGHLDVYVNEAIHQPGCNEFKRWACKFFHAAVTFSSGGYFSCSHGRATQLFIESITTNCPFNVFKCDSFESLERGLCLDCPTKGCNALGFKSKPEREHGKVFLKTASSFPFCRHHYGVSLTLGSESTGTIEAGVKGPEGHTKLKEFSDDNTPSGTVLRKLVLGKKIQVKSVLVKYKKSWWWGGQKRVKISDVTVTSVKRGQSVRSVTCPGAADVVVKSGRTVGVPVDDQC